MAEKEINVVIESPWKKIIIVGIVIIAFVIVTELFSRYFENNKLFTFYNILIALAIILVIILIIVFFKRKNNILVGKNKAKKSNEITDKDLKKVLKIIDSLFEKLPDKEINKFAKSEDANLYKAVLKKYGAN